MCIYCWLSLVISPQDDVFPMYKACKDSKDQGGFHDFVEILKLYDKNDDNTMLAHELFRLLTNLGEKLTKEEAKSLMKELCEPADDEGFMPFIRKYQTQKHSDPPFLSQQAIGGYL